MSITGFSRNASIYIRRELATKIQRLGVLVVAGQSLLFDPFGGQIGRQLLKNHGFVLIFEVKIQYYSMYQLSVAEVSDIYNLKVEGLLWLLVSEDLVCSQLAMGKAWWGKSSLQGDWEAGECGRAPGEAARAQVSLPGLQPRPVLVEVHFINLPGVPQASGVSIPAMSLCLLSHHVLC